MTRATGHSVQGVDTINSTTEKKKKKPSPCVVACGCRIAWHAPLASRRQVDGCTRPLPPGTSDCQTNIKIIVYRREEHKTLFIDKRVEMYRRYSEVRSSRLG